MKRLNYLFLRCRPRIIHVQTPINYYVIPFFTSAPEFPENHEQMFPQYYIKSNVINGFKTLTTQ